MSLSESDIDAFGRFAKEQLHQGIDLSLPQLLGKWESEREAEAVRDDVSQGARDIEQGNGCSVADAFQSVRNSLPSDK